MEGIGIEIGLALAITIILVFTPPYILRLILSILEQNKKRREIKLGDKIIFHKLPDKIENVSVVVMGFSVFSTFKDLFSNFNNQRFGHNNLSIDQQLEKIRKIYSQEEENKNGVVGIHIKLIS